MEIFASDTGEWLEFEFSCQKPVFAFDWLLENAFVCNGVLHWSDLYVDAIFAFDPYKIAEYRTIDYPNKDYRGDDWVSIRLLGERRGRLRYTEFHGSNFRIWEVKDYSTGEWCLVHKFHCSEIVSENAILAKSMSGLFQWCSCGGRLHFLNASGMLLGH